MKEEIKADCPSVKKKGGIKMESVGEVKFKGIDAMVPLGINGGHRGAGGGKRKLDNKNRGT